VPHHAHEVLEGLRRQIWQQPPQQRLSHGAPAEPAL
jgi:hypothetical protein